MKFFIASDLHGSAYYTELMLREFDKSGASHLLILGDILYHGPRNDLPRDYAPKKVAALLNEYADRIIAVRGNCEAEVDSLMLDFPPTPDYAAVFDGTTTMYISHGHREIPKLTRGTVYLTGHTHVPHDYEKDGIRFINPGSVSIPKENSLHSAIVYENGCFNWLNIENGSFYTL